LKKSQTPAPRDPEINGWCNEHRGLNLAKMRPLTVKERRVDKKKGRALKKNKVGWGGHLAVEKGKKRKWPTEQNK